MRASQHETSVVIREPSYDRAYVAFMQLAVEGLIREDPTLGQIKMIPDRHAGPIRNVRAETPLDQPMMGVSATVTLERGALLRTDVDGHTAMLYDTAQQIIGEQSRAFYQRLSEITTAAGTSVKNIGQGVPTIEQLRELFRKMEFSFNERGELSGLQLHVHPSQMERAKENLTQASHKLAEQMYKAAQPQGGGQPGPGAGPTPGTGAGDGQAKKDEGVIDAEYVDVEDKK